ncbi:MAG: type II/IV secretion system protein [Phycisphaerae bacterium]|nr:type II/IV secretion system protein [Phycisphaerae bacterium]
MQLIEGKPAAEHSEPSDDFLTLVPRDFARRHLVCSRGTERSAGDALSEIVEASSRTPPAVKLNLSVRLGRVIRFVVLDDEEIARHIDKAYDGFEARSRDKASPGTPIIEVIECDLDSAIEQSMKATDRDLLSLDGKGPVIRLVDAMFFEALSKNASDIHIQPLADRTLVRYRVDGVLFIAREVPHSLTQALISRIKVMGQMDVAERHAPQDGRATVTMGRSRSSSSRPPSRTPSPTPPRSPSHDAPPARSIDLRISTLPTNYGERAVIRLLDNARGTHLADFASLGMPMRVRSSLLDRAERSHGIILVTGPTGSGKTTTLYTLLRHIATGGEGPSSIASDAPPELTPRRSGRKRGDLNIMTIEDPIEYELSTSGIAISQSQINPKKGVTFATGLRHILRQDPDVVMVGEIRDAETTRIAMQASLTGHLVLSTLHTNDAASAVTRLIDLGAEPYLVAASLSTVMAQRLVRRLHQACRGKGCEGCLDTGYAGRLGVFELLLIDDGLRHMIAHSAQLGAIRDHACKRGMTTLLEEGQRLVTRGQTDDFEMRRVLQGMEDEQVQSVEEIATNDA